MSFKTPIFEQSLSFKKNPTRFFRILTVLTLSLVVMSWKPLSHSKHIEFKSGVQSIQENASVELTMTYDVPRFKAGQIGISKPSVSKPGGTFSYTRVNADSYGGLNINLVTGWISHSSSNPGTYEVTYTYNNLKTTATVVVE